jgi:hypothetical protein
MEPTGLRTATGWYTSTYSGGEGDCVEVAALATGGIAVRDSKAPEGPVLAFGAGAWQAFVEEARERRIAGG